MFKATVAGLLAHKLRLVLTAFAIVLGVAFVSATLTLSNGLQTTFDNIFNTTSTGVAVVVRGHIEPGGQNGGFSDAHRVHGGQSGYAETSTLRIAEVRREGYRLE